MWAVRVLPIFVDVAGEELTHLRRPSEARGAAEAPRFWQARLNARSSSIYLSIHGATVTEVCLEYTRCVKVNGFLETSLNPDSHQSTNSAVHESTVHSPGSSDDTL